jgi:hypothetical protein
MRSSDHTYLNEEDRISVEKISTGSIEVYFAGSQSVKSGFMPNIAQHISMSAEKAQELRDELDRALAVKLPLLSAAALAAVKTEAVGTIR